MVRYRLPSCNTHSTLGKRGLTKVSSFEEPIPASRLNDRSIGQSGSREDVRVYKSIGAHQVALVDCSEASSPSLQMKTMMLQLKVQMYPWRLYILDW